MNRWILVAVASVCVATLDAAPFSRNRKPVEQPPQQQEDPMRDLLLDLRHQIANQEAELRTLRQRLENQEQIIDGVRDNTDRFQSLTQEVVKNHGSTIESKVAFVAANHDQLGQDLQLLQQYANTVKELLEQYHSRMQTLENTVDKHTKNLKSMEVAVQSLVEAFPAGDKPIVSIEGTDTIYRVVDGDTLEKIARRNQTTIRKLKEVNNLATDRIIVGQKLKLPQASES